MTTVDGRLVVARFKENIRREFAEELIEYLGYEQRGNSKEVLYDKHRIMHILATDRNQKKDVIQELKKYNKFIEDVIDPFPKV